MRLLNGEQTENVAEKIHSLRPSCRARVDAQLAARQLVVRQSARLQAGHVSSDRDRVFVFIGRAMNDFINHCFNIMSSFHCPMLIGSVRAWLKYLLDRLFDHEGSNPSNSRRKFASRER